jgi:hypothetical protein
MLQDVEDILDSWEQTGVLQDCTDRFNIALCLETQRRANEKYDHSEQFNRVSIPAILNICKQRPDTFQGLVESECTDVYRLGPMPGGNDVDVCAKLVMRVLDLNLDMMYFGGLTLKDGFVYVLTDRVDSNT